MALFSKIPLFIFLLMLACPSPVPAADPAAARASMRIVAMDPEPDAFLTAGERLYLRISYESPIPVRFEPEAIRQGTVQEHAGSSSSPPYDAGRGEALVWFAMSSPVRIDTIRVTAYDLEWQELGTFTAPAVVTWEYHEHAEPRASAAWVEPMLKKHRRVFDTAFDPLPEKPRPLFDIFFMISFLAIPFYLLMQAQMLIRYRGKWQWYAAAPLLPIVPLGLYSLIGLGLSRVLWVKFLFHYMAAALLYLLILWLVKRDRERGLRKGSAQTVDSSSGTE